MTNPKQNKDALGKGIRSLLQNIDADLKNTTGQLKPQAVEAATGVIRLPLENIETNPKQPRRDLTNRLCRNWPTPLSCTILSSR